MSAAIGMRLKNPAHPGGFIRHEIIAPLGLSVTGAAEVLGVTRATLSTLLNERAHLSPEMALGVEKAFGVSMDTLMRMQNSYDIAQTRKRERDIKVTPFKGKPRDRAARRRSGFSSPPTPARATENAGSAPCASR